MKVALRRLDDIALDARISLIKVDIEGHEAAFLRGARQRIREDRPIVFAEMLPNAADSFYEVSSMMKENNYYCFRLRPDAAILTPYVTHDPLAWNYGFIPEDKMPLFRQVCSIHQVEVVRPF